MPNAKIKNSTAEPRAYQRVKHPCPICGMCRAEVVRIIPIGYEAQCLECQHIFIIQTHDTKPE